MTGTSAGDVGDQPTQRGFRLVPHTADCIVEAWGPDRCACLAEAVSGLVSVFAGTADAVAATVLPVAIDPAPDADILVSLLEEVVYTVEVFGKVPVRVHLGEREDGGIAGDLEVVDASELPLIGPVPKGVAYHDLAIGPGPGAWRCHVVVDV